MWLCLLIVCFGAGPATAQEPLAAPTGEVLLVITGAITLPNVGDEAHLDQGHLNALARERYSTDTPWSKDGAHEFEGARLDAVLQAVGAKSQAFEGIGFDDYAATFSDLDITTYPIIIADTMDGEALTLRKLGPLRIMFPFDDFPELRSETTTAMSVWQLVRMDVH